RSDALVALVRAALNNARRGRRLSLEHVKVAWRSEGFGSEAAWLIATSLRNSELAPFSAVEWG
ncbi:MAG: hypothetical protein ACXVHB_34040, partial [Solirubrobacteraceae bacterium]